MISRWAELRPNAIALRKRGASIRDIERRMGIPRSTLSGWFQSIELSVYHKKILEKRREAGMVTARKMAVVWHNAKKAERIAEAARTGEETLQKIDHYTKEIIELALALLYLGEGAKKTLVTSLGNSDPLILRFFISALRQVYTVPLKDIRCELHLRADQDPESLKKYWSKTLRVPLSNFGAVAIDARTKGIATYPHYKGVCVVRCSRVAIQRKLMYISRGFCEKIANNVIPTRA